MKFAYRIFSILIVKGVLLFSTSISAHGLEPIFMSVITMENNQYRVELRLPDEYKEENSPYFLLPEHCENKQFNSLISIISCNETLVGETLQVIFDYYVPQVSTLINYYDFEGNNQITELDDELIWTVPVETSTSASNQVYLIVGLEHILGGFDHVLFIICLLMIVKSKKKLIQTITGFTIAHSMTLVMVSLGIINPSIEPIELIVALSVLLLAYEIATDSNGLTGQEHECLIFVQALNSS